jgi:ABC-2 type transport system ATP-binding protein
MNLSIRNLSKTYSSGAKALQNVNLEISTGMFGLLGPNGAGKSTLMRTISTLQAPDSGEIHFGSINALTQKDELRRKLGYLPQEFGLYPKLSAEKLLNHFAILKGIVNKRERQNCVQELLELTNLWQTRKESLGNYSGGMKQRFGIAQALLGQPELIIVDEPTAGLDPEERVRFHNLLSLIGENVVVILSTHIVSDVSVLCSSMAIINKGEVILTGAPEELIAHCENKIWEKEISKSEQYEHEAIPEMITSRLVSGQKLVRYFSNSNPGSGFIPADNTLEDVYFAAIKGLMKNRGGER